MTTGLTTAQQDQKILSDVVMSRKVLLDFLEGIRMGESNTRVFAVTGDSGMGKSSLIAKIRSRINKH